LAHATCILHQGILGEYLGDALRVIVVPRVLEGAGYRRRASSPGRSEVLRTVVGPPIAAQA
jgi:hypothetical protein